MHQPYLHDLVCVLRAPVQMWTDHTGQSDGSGVQGIFLADDRVASRVELTVPSHLADSIGASAQGPTATFRSLLRTDDGGADPVVSLTRKRIAGESSLREEIRLASVAASPQRVRVVLELTPDGTPLELLKVGAETLPVPQIEVRDGARWRWRGEPTWAHLSSDGRIDAGSAIRVTWEIELAEGSEQTLTWRLDLSAGDSPFVSPKNPSLGRPASSRDDLDRLLESSRADLQALLLADARTPDLMFTAAGAPWFFTLFGRDSLIAASMLARSNPELAVATLRTLGNRLGTRVDASKAEEPGKVLHEVRRTALDLHDNSTVLPPEYYGSIDSTLLWIMLLGQLTEQGEDPAPFLDNLLATLGWLEAYGDADGDGFLEYYDASGHGLANQGWKDSGDSIRFADGRIAEGPIVLIEVQGYAYAAARVGARILGRHGRTEEEKALAARWDRYADDMASRVRERFWVSDERGSYPALALDRDKRPVTGVASNMGHLLGLGILNGEEERLVVDRLLAPDMFSGYGIRTMSTTNGAYWPWRYHVGSVWTHDTAWIIRGLHLAGFTKEARTVAEGLLRALMGFDGRAPELFAGVGADEAWPPLPYPASCRPQAWAAASAYVLAEVLGWVMPTPASPPGMGRLAPARVGPS